MTRGRFQGVRQMVRFNRGRYVQAVGALGAALVAAARLGGWWRAGLVAMALPGLFWLAASVVTAHYVYDRSGLYGLGWLGLHLPEARRRWVNFHAGLDETSAGLARVCGSATGAALDIYDAREMTEPSIGAARRRGIRAVVPAAADWRALPLADGSVDVALVMFVAHELRRGPARAEWFREVARVLRRGGRAAVVEHVRDGANWLAFGPGALHFFPAAAWRRAGEEAGLGLRAEVRLNRFVRLFVLERMG